MNLPWWGDILGAGVAVLVWAATLDIHENKKAWLKKRPWLGWIVNPLGALASIAVPVLVVIGLVKAVKCGFCGPWGD